MVEQDPSIKQLMILNKKKNLDKSLIKGRVTKSSVGFGSIIRRKIPDLIKNQEGIFDDEIPHCKEIANKFDINQFSLIILSLVLNFG